MIELQNNIKPSKKEAYEILLDCKISKNREISNSDIDKLINFFAPPLPKIAKTTEQWVAKAVANKNESRYYLQHLFVCDGLIYGSNGAVLHWGKTMLKNGFYDSKTMISIKCDAPYPKFDEIISQEYTDEITFKNINEISKIVATNKVNAYCISKNKCYIDEKNLNNAINGIVGELSFTRNRIGAIKCESNPLGNFIIMPLKVK